MALVRLFRRRRQPVDPRSSISIDNRTAFSQFEQVLPIYGTRGLSENQAQYSYLTDWHYLPSRFAKKKTRTTESTERLVSKSVLVPNKGRPDSSGTVPSISPLQSSRKNNKETLDLNPDQVSSVVPSRISVSDQNQQQIKSIYPQSILIGPRILNKPCSCHIIMSYRSDPTFHSMSHYSRRDEVTIFQVANNGSSWIVFKGFLKMDDSFAFKSQRSIDDRFHLKLEINGSLDTTISACCEHSYRGGGRIDDGDSSFWIKTVEQYTSCAKCHESIDLSQSSDDEQMTLASNATSEESEAEEDQSVASKKSTDKSVIDMKKVPEVQSFPSLPPVSHKPQSTEVLPPPTLSSSTVHKTTTQKAPSVSVSKVPAKTADDESTLFKYVNDVMQQTLSKPKSSKTIPPRHIGNVENFTILSIDQNEQSNLSLLRPTVNFIRIMNDPKTLGTLLAASTDEKLIIVISLNQAEVLLSELQQHKCIQSICFLSKQTHLPEWINHYDKVIEIYQNIESIRDHLIKALPHIASRLISIEITSKDSTSDRAFTYCHLLKETILCQDDESDLRKDMLAFCRIHYAQNQEVLHEIEEFEKSFTETHSIQWYTRHCFLSKILSRAFRTREIDLLFKMRYFIQCLRKQIQSIAIKEPITVYAILNVEQETIQQVRENINGLVLFRSFLPATFEQPTSMTYENTDKQKYLVFSIRLEPNCAANIEQLCSSGCKIDVLINIDTVFRVISIDEGDNGVDTVNLESVPHSDPRFQQLTATLREETKAPVVIVQLTKLLLQTDHYCEGDYLTELIHQDKSFEGDGTLLASLAAAHHLLGNVDVAKRDFEAARYHFFKSLRAFQLFLPYDHSMLSSTYNNIGNMFYQDNHHECAIKFHEMALECQLKASNPDADSIVTYSTNIGAVYIDQKNYNQAVIHLKRSAMILETMSMNDNTKHLISIFQKISSCFWHTKEFKEALEYYKKTLDLQLKLPNPLPHPLSVTYYNLSTAYGRIGDYDGAVTCAEKSIEYLRMISESHPELKENQAQLEIVRQKQWLKEVLSAKD